MFQVIGEQVAKECNVSYAKEFFLFTVTGSVEVSLGTQLAQLVWSDRMHTDLTLLHSRTIASLVSRLVRCT